jgi:diguanylate cyclase (GGDEF)-like protein/PAS domain S-box-containing protein
MDHSLIFDFAFHIALDGVFVLNPEGIIVDVNADFEKLLGFSKAELVEQSVKRIIPRANDENVPRILRQIMNKDRGYIEIQLEKKNLELIDSYLMFSFYQPLDLLFVFVKDLTFYKNQHRELSQLKKTLDMLDSYVYIKDDQGRYQYANELTLKLFNATAEEVKGTKDYDYFPVTVVERLRMIDQQVLKGHQSAEEIVVNHDDGTKQVYLELKAPLRNEDGSIHHILGISYDITERKRLEEEVRELSIRDPLTNLYNRRYINERLESDMKRYLQKKEFFSLVLLDIDFFKSINDRYGHVVGDQVLQVFSKTLEKELGSKHLVGRYGGEEFIMILYDMNHSESLKKMKSLSATIQQTLLDVRNGIKIKFSAGIISVDELDELDYTPKNMIEKADQNLLLAKQNGRNMII